MQLSYKQFIGSKMHHAIGVYFLMLPHEGADNNTVYCRTF